MRRTCAQSTSGEPCGESLGLFSLGQLVIVDPPRHAAELLVSRGQLVRIQSVLEPLDGETRYRIVSYEAGTGHATAELVVPEGWLRPKGTLVRARARTSLVRVHARGAQATSTECEHISIGALLRGAWTTGGFQIPLFQATAHQHHFSTLWGILRTPRYITWPQRPFVSSHHRRTIAL